MIDRDVALLLIGGTIGLVSAFIGALVQHSLSLRADRIKRERDRREREREQRRERLPAGIRKLLMRYPDLDVANSAGQEQKETRDEPAE